MGVLTPVEQIALGLLTSSYFKWSYWKIRSWCHTEVLTMLVKISAMHHGYKQM